jgi:hypothetical protein
VVWAEVDWAPIAGTGVTQVNRVGIRFLPLSRARRATGGRLHDRFADRPARSRQPTEGPGNRAQHRRPGARHERKPTTPCWPRWAQRWPLPAILGTTLGIGDAEAVTIALDKQLPAGPWDARITRRSGLVERSARATITFPATGAAPLVITSSTRPGWLHPAITGLLVFLLLVIVAPLVVLMRHRPHRHPRPGRRETMSRSTIPMATIKPHPETGCPMSGPLGYGRCVGIPHPGCS